MIFSYLENSLISEFFMKEIKIYIIALETYLQYDISKSDDIKISQWNWNGPCASSWSLSSLFIDTMLKCIHIRRLGLGQFCYVLHTNAIQSDYSQRCKLWVRFILLCLISCCLFKVIECISIIYWYCLHLKHALVILRHPSLIINSRWQNHAVDRNCLQQIILFHCAIQIKIWIVNINIILINKALNTIDCGHNVNIFQFIDMMVRLVKSKDALESVHIFAYG